MAQISKSIEIVASSFVKDATAAFPVTRAFIFGSYANGTPNEDSDLDIAIFTDSFHGRKSIEFMQMLFKIARKYPQICIEPIVLEETDITDENPFAQEVLRTGYAIYLH